MFKKKWYGKSTGTVPSDKLSKEVLAKMIRITAIYHQVKVDQRLINKMAVIWPYFYDKVINKQLLTLYIRKRCRTCIANS